MSDLLDRQLQKQRTIDRALENFKKIGKANLTASKIRSRMAALKDVYHKFADGHAALSHATPSANRAAMDYFQANVFDATEDNYQNALDFMVECLEELEPVVSPNNSFSFGEANRSHAGSATVPPLPPIRVPPFDGNLNEWEHFRDRFTTVVLQNRDLNDFSRMHYLTSSVTGRALECISTFAITGENFHSAWAALKSRYDNKQRLLAVHFNALLGLPTLARESGVELQTLQSRANAAVASLRNLKRTSAELWNDFLVHLVSHRVDPTTRQAWSLRASASAELPSFDELNEFLSHRVIAWEAKVSEQPGSSSSKSGSVSRVHVISASANSSSSCPVCNARHYFSACPSFTRGTPVQRRDLVNKFKRCFNCLSGKHSVRECSSKFTCRVCKLRHHSLLHSSGESKPEPVAVASRSDTVGDMHRADSEINSLVAAVERGIGSCVLLATARVRVSTVGGRSATVRALLDQGSEMTFISERLAQTLRVKRIRTSVTLVAVGCVQAGSFRHAAEISVSAQTSSHPVFSVTALILPTLTSYAPNQILTESDLQSFADLDLADSTPCHQDPIDLLVGADLYSRLMQEGIRRDESGRLLAQKTSLGWVLSGTVSSRYGANRHSPPKVAAESRSAHLCTTLDEQVSRFWEVEEVPARAIPSAEDARCEKHFLDTHSRDYDGRYIVRLPFRFGPPVDIGDSRIAAEQSLSRLTRRLHDEPDRAREYSRFLREYESLDHMRRVDHESGPASQIVYIPHHPVFRTDAGSSQLRVVFNASARTSNGLSLNDRLYAGPKLQSDLAAVVLRWRQFRYVLAADIAKMFRQIRVDRRDVDYQRILWSPSSDEPVHEYRLMTVTYGMSCAPFLALRVLRQLVLDEGSRYPLAARILCDNIYVDDLLFGHNDLTALFEIREQLVSLLRRGGFELHKWASNHPELVGGLDTRCTAGRDCRQLADDHGRKILGLDWEPSLDCFQFSVSLSDDVHWTKRSVLAAVAKLFDPLGWVTPATVMAKIFMQRLWRLRLSWDDAIPEPHVSHWRRVCVGLGSLDACRVSRWTGLAGDPSCVSLDGFADASSSAYAAVVYLRVDSASGRSTVSLLAGKSRVAPVKPMSVPRLELLAAVLLARLLKFVRESLGFESVPCRCWTDSSVVLAWLSGHPSRWKTFVANRVLIVQESLPGVAWGHVRTAENPADCASRGLLGSELLAHTLWWRGPSWLTLPLDEWPSPRVSRVGLVPASFDMEERVVPVHVARTEVVWDLSNRYSSWPRLLRITGWLYRFVGACRGGSVAGSSESGTGLSLSASEISRAREFWLQRVQAVLFESEISALTRSRQVGRRSPLLSLNPFLDACGLLRVGGRLRHAPKEFPARHPIILASHPLVHMIIDQTHARALHSGVQLTLSLLRHDYWLIRGRSVVRNRIRRCVTCARAQAEIPQQLMGDLPAARVSAPTRCFLHSGVDYAGPFLVRASVGRGIKTIKCYVALFICLASRAIHLELVSDYSASAFVHAFQRFCSRRGLPSDMYSDNGTTFVGGDRTLSESYRAALRDERFRAATAADGIEWHFIPPSAPHFGGLWEAGVKSLKYHLRRVMGNQTLSFEELSTVLCRVEACLNSRPIAPLSDAYDDYEALTPGHLLIGSALLTHPEPSTLDLNEDRLSRWQRVRHINERFWRVWSDDYINTLQQRQKWRVSRSPIEVGQLVILRNAGLPPCKWDLGRVIRCHPGADGMTRVVTVRTARSEFVRPISKLCLLPIACAAT